MLKGMNFVSNYKPDERTDENAAQPVYRLRVPVCLEKSLPGRVKLWTKIGTGIFACRAMVDTARECLCYQKET